MKDLFDEPFDKLPIKVRNVLNNYLWCEFDYENCANLVDDLNKVGYTCEYYLNAEPFGLRRLTKEEKKNIKNNINTILD